jgi:hypothetical protein
MTNCELTNIERSYFGLKEVKDSWVRSPLDDFVVVYFDEDTIVKVLNFQHGYIEYDADVSTESRGYILPRATKGSKKKLTVARLLTIKGNGIEFSGSIHGGGIQVFHHGRKLTFIRSYLEEGPIRSCSDIDKWVQRFIAESPSGYFDWLSRQLGLPKRRISVREGDIIAFDVSRFEYAFASIIKCDYLSEHKLLDGEILESNYFGEPLLILPYQQISDSLDVDVVSLIKCPTLRPIEILKHNVSNGTFPIVAFRRLSYEAIEDVELFSLKKYLTIPLSKTDIVQGEHKF